MNKKCKKGKKLKKDKKCKKGEIIMERKLKVKSNIMEKSHKHRLKLKVIMDMSKSNICKMLKVKDKKHIIKKDKIKHTSKNKLIKKGKNMEKNKHIKVKNMDKNKHIKKVRKIKKDKNMFKNKDILVQLLRLFFCFGAFSFQKQFFFADLTNRVLFLLYFSANAFSLLLLFLQACLKRFNLTGRS